MLPISQLDLGMIEIIIYCIVLQVSAPYSITSTLRVALYRDAMLYYDVIHPHIHMQTFGRTCRGEVRISREESVQSGAFGDRGGVVAGVKHAFVLHYNCTYHYWRVGWLHHGTGASSDMHGGGERTWW